MSAIHGMRNPMNSWDKSDSYETHGEFGDQFFFGDNDLALAQKLVRSGSDHRKFLRQIFVSVSFILSSSSADSSHIRPVSGS